MFKNKNNLKISKKDLKLNKKGISVLVESAGMFFLIAMIMGLVLQVTVWSMAQITVKGAAYEAARGGSKVGKTGCVARSKIIATQYGGGLAFWDPKITVTLTAQVTVTVTQKVPIIGSLFPQITVQGVSKQIVEEIA